MMHLTPPPSASAWPSPTEAGLGWGVVVLGLSFLNGAISLFFQIDGTLPHGGLVSFDAQQPGGNCKASCLDQWVRLEDLDGVPSRPMILCSKTLLKLLQGWVGGLVGRSTGGSALVGLPLLRTLYVASSFLKTALVRRLLSLTRPTASHSSSRPSP